MGTPATPESPQGELSHIASLCVPLALTAHQIFRRYETYSLLAHTTLLLGPPALVANYVAAQPYHALGFLAAFKLSCLVYLSALLTSVITYRLSPFHPLAKYPGPLLWRVSMFSSGLYSTTGNKSRYIKKLHDIHGDIIRIGPNELSIRDPSAAQALLGVNGAPKGPDFVGGMLSDRNLPMVGILDLDEHLMRRRRWNRALAPSALKEYEGRVSERARALIQRIGEQPGEIILGKWIDYFSYDFMCDMAFGGGSELLRDGDKNHIWHVLEQGMVVATFFAHVPWLGVHIGRIPFAAAALNALLTRGRELAAARVARGSEIRDLFHYLSNEDQPDKPPPPQSEVIDDGILAVVAGSDTTSSALTSVFFCLLTHPAAYARVQEEVDKYYPQGEDAFSPKHHRELQYLQAVINEALRLFPPVAGGSLRKTLPGKPLVAGSIVIPPESGYRLSPYAMQMDERSFSFPGVFWPERWLVASGSLSLTDALARLPNTSVRGPPPTIPSLAAKDEKFKLAHDDAAFIVFSYGPMNCPGKGLAMLEMRTVACALVQRFRLRLREGWDTGRYEAGYKDYFSATRPELPVLLERRW